MTALIGVTTKVAAGCLAAALVAGGAVATTGDGDTVGADTDFGLDVGVATDTEIGVSDGGSQDDATDRSDGTTDRSDGTTDGTTTAVSLALQPIALRTPTACPAEPPAQTLQAPIRPARMAVSRRMPVCSQSTRSPT